MFDRRTSLAKEVKHVISERFGGMVFDTIIPVCVKLAEAPSHRKPICIYAPSNKIGKIYRELAEEFLTRLID